MPLADILLCQLRAFAYEWQYFLGKQNLFPCANFGAIIILVIAFRVFLFVNSN